MKPKPYFFLIFLFIILVFILGVRYGQRVEKNNKVVNYLLSITPTKIPPTPTEIKKDASTSPTLFNLKK